MEIRSSSLLAIACFLTLLFQPLTVAGALAEQPVVVKRAISSYSNGAQKQNIVEGSGSSPAGGKKKNLAAADIEWEASGVGPDDEDGDVVEGSGSDEVAGSGAVPPAVKSPPLLKKSTTTTTTTTVAPRPPVEVDEYPNLRGKPASGHDTIGLEQDVKIEEETTTTSTSAPPRNFVPLSTQKAPIPTVFEEDTRHAPFDALFKPGILAAVIGGVVVGILAAILLVMFVVYRMRKKDEGSYALDEPKQPPHYSYAYQKAPTKEFYA